VEGYRIGPDGAMREQELSRLAALSPAAYGVERQAASERLGIPLGFLDEERAARHKADAKPAPGQGTEIGFPEILPADESVTGSQLLSELVAVVERYVILPPHAAVAVSLWIIFTYCFDLFSIAPRLALESPVKRCGKTTLFTVLVNLVRRALLASNLSPSVVFRVVEKHAPTLLIDEMDSLEVQDELRGILNSGHTREAARVIRNVGDEHEPRVFSTWAPVAFACIGRLPDTLEDRSILIQMRRKTRSEPVASLRQVGAAAALFQETAASLNRQIVRWVADARLQLLAAAPTIPDALGDRAKDNWSPLLAIAEAVGGDWPKRAADAALALSGTVETDTESIRVQLLADIRLLFEHGSVDRFSSDDLCQHLTELEERPWTEWRKGKPLSTHQLADLLRPFEVRSRTLRLPNGGRLKGYPLEDFQDAWARYLPPLPPDSPLSKRDTVTTRASIDDPPLFQSVTDEVCHGSKNGINPAPGAECHAVTVQKPESRGEETMEVFSDAD
jgi:putative DNA primase/helicase